MPKASDKTVSTDREVAALKAAPGGARAEYRVKGSPGLVIRVSARGEKVFVLWLKRSKTRQWQKLTLGRYPDAGLAWARAEAIKVRAAVIEGSDPIGERRAEQVTHTFADLAAAYIERHAKPKKKSWAEDARLLAKDVNPVLGGYVAKKVVRLDVVALLDGIVDRGAPVLANRVLALVRKVFSFGVAEGYVDLNPATGIPLRAREEARTRTLTEAEIATFWRALGREGFDATTADALRLQLLLGARVREVTEMRAAELRLGEAPPVWVLPRARSKGGCDVVRPLPPLALAIVRRRLAGGAGSQFVFASPTDLDAPITPGAPSRALRRGAALGRLPAGFTPHDLRRTCRTYLAKLGVAEPVCQKILGQSPPRGDVTASVYDQHTYVPEMAEALGRWEAFVLALGEDAGTAPARAEAAE